MKRGEVWWTSVNERNPVVILSCDDAHEIRAMLIVAPATTDIRGVAVEVKVGADEGLLHEAVLRVALARPGRINCNWLVTLTQTDLSRYAGTLSPAKLRQLDDALRRGDVDGFQRN